MNFVFMVKALKYWDSQFFYSTPPPLSLSLSLSQLKCIPLAGEQSVFCMWVTRDLDGDRAKNGDSKPDPYWNDQVLHGNCYTV